MAGNTSRESLVGKPAPGFTLKDSRLKDVSLGDFAGRTVVLAFFPAAFSSTCSCELGTFRDRYGELHALNAVVLGISVDLPWTLRRYRVEEMLQFPLLSDFDRTAIRAYGVVDDNFQGYHSGVAQRSIVVVDPEGTVRWEWVSGSQGELPDFGEMLAALERLALVTT